jgi:hypothetical protein
MDTITINSFEDFVEAIFAMACLASAEFPWYDDVHFELTLEACAEYYVQLFESPGFLLERFNDFQLKEGFDAMWDINFGLSVPELIGDKRLSIENRERVVAAMVPLYQQFFAIKPLQSSTYMWWDIMVKWPEEERRLQEAIFAALREILMIPDEDCQEAALHGLGHLRHPGTKGLIQEYLAAYPSLSAHMRCYALEAAEGNVW